MDVAKCARALRSLVHQMCEDRDRRTMKAPLDKEAASLLAEVLTDLIREACRHNRDIYNVSSWNRNAEPYEPERERNLYAYLIGNPPSDPSFPPWMRDHFVIDRLREFPVHEWGCFLGRLATIKEIIGQWDTDDMPATRAYARRIEDMLREYAAANEVGSSAAA